MKTRRTTLAAGLLSVSLLLSGACLAKDKAAGDDMGARAANLARFEAAVRSDTAALDKLLADDLDYCHSNGECEGKAAYLDSFKAGTMKYRSIEPTVDRIKLVGSVAIILGHAHVNATRNGADLNIDIGYTSVFILRDGRWQLSSWRSITLPAKSATRGDEASARAAVLARFDAALHNDVPALDKLLADDLDYCTFRGDCLTKAAYLGLVKTGSLKYVSAESTVSRVKLFADTAVATGVAHVTAIRDGKQDVIHISWSAVLDWRDGRWLMTTWTSTLLESAK